MRIVETDNHGGDYPYEEFVNLPRMQEDQAKLLCDMINLYCSGDRAPRYWKVVENNYVLDNKGPE